MRERVEQDSLGEMAIPKEAYYGIQTLRAKKNFQISDSRTHTRLIEALAMVKKACALTNGELGLLTPTIGEAIVEAANDVVEGDLKDQFILDAFQGGAGTSINMNMNEVLANRALEILGYEKGDYQVVHPNNHVNMGQSTNDVVPTAARIAVIFLLQELVEVMGGLLHSLYQKRDLFLDVLKMGRTHLQDAIPIRMGQEFGAYACMVERDRERLESSLHPLERMNMGATAIGTGLNADPAYIEEIPHKLQEVTGLSLITGENMVDITQNLDPFLEVSSMLKITAINLSKLASDLRLLSSGPCCGLNEINLPPVQPGSSIMPGKVNPVIPEIINQIAAQIKGNDLTIASAVEMGQLELNVMLPVVIYNLIQSLEILINGVETFTKNCIQGLTANREVCKEHVESSIGVITAINPHLGYDQASRIAHKALEEKRSIREVILEEGYLTSEELDEILDPLEMTQPGIAGKRLFEEG